MPATIAFAESINHGFWESMNHARGGAGPDKTVAFVAHTAHGFLRYGFDSSLTLSGSTSTGDWPYIIAASGLPEIAEPRNKNYHCFQRKKFTQSLALTDNGGSGALLSQFVTVTGSPPYPTAFTGLSQIDQYDNDSKYKYLSVTHTEVQAGDGVFDSLFTSADTVSDSVTGTSRTIVRARYIPVYDVGTSEYVIGFPGFGTYVADMEFTATVVVEWSQDYTWSDYTDDFDSLLWSQLPSDKWSVNYTLDENGDIVSISPGVGSIGRIATMPGNPSLVAGAGFVWNTNRTGATYYPKIPIAAFATYTMRGPAPARYSCKGNGTTTPTSLASAQLSWAADNLYYAEPSSGDVSSMLGSDEQKQYHVYWSDAYNSVTPNYPLPT